MRMEGVYYREAAVYVSLTNTEEELKRKGIFHLVSERMRKQRTRPTVLSWKTEHPRKRWSWQNKKTEKQMNETEKRRLMREVTENLTIAVFENHFYRWQGKNWKQMAGGGVGLRGKGTQWNVSCLQNMKITY